MACDWKFKLRESAGWEGAVVSLNCSNSRLQSRKGSSESSHTVSAAGGIPLFVQSRSTTRRVTGAKAATLVHQALLKQDLRSAVRGLGIGDAVLLLYIAVFVRQYLWIVHNNLLAWILTLLLSLLIWLVHLRTKQPAEERTPLQFWLVVALPLLAVYAMRAAFPDTTFDVLDYRLINAERSLRGFPFIIGDFFPVRFPFNPAPDMLTGVSRHILGYRLGTIINYLVVLWAGTILNRLIRPYIRSAWWRCLGVLLLLLTEHLLFIISNYMVDLLALPLLLEATRLAVSNNPGKLENQNTVRIALLLGASVALKLTNLAFAVPILVVYAYNSIIARERPLIVRDCILLVAAFVAPLLPFTLYIYWQTGNPVFPLYNKIFRSAFWPISDFVGVRWGPVVDDPRWAHMKWWEVLLWPVLVPFKLENTAPGLGRHAGRLSVCIVAALLGLIVKMKDRHARSLSFIALGGAFLWSAISGMPRYAIFLELTGGVVVLYLASLFHPRKNDSDQRRLLTRSLQVLIFGILVAQSAVACIYVYRFEWGSRPSFFQNPKAYTRDSKYFLRDYSLLSYLPYREKALIRPVEVWVESNALESGIEALLNSNGPALCVYMPEYFSTEASRTKFANTLRELRDKKMYALSFSEHLEGSLSHITRAGLGVGRIATVVIPYYSEHTRIHMVLIEILPSGEGNAGELIRLTRLSSALPFDAFKAELSWSQPLPAFRAGLKETVYLKVKNISSVVWPALGRNDGAYRVFMGDHWLDENNTIVVNDDGRSALVHDLGPGAEVEIPLTITAPATPGNYVLEVDMLQEGVTWFSLKGSKTLRAKVTVGE